LRARSNRRDSCHTAHSITCNTRELIRPYGKDGGKSRLKREAADRWISGRDVWGKTVETQSLKLPDGTVLTMIALVK